MSTHCYPFTEIEPKWQQFWEEHRLFEAEDGSKKPKFYCLDMFPYPSASGLHVGHVEGYTATDIISRQRRMQGFNVLHPMGWDAFGLPAEQYAFKEGVHPEVTTRRAIDNYRRQLKSLGLSYDWSREVDTTDPKYYRWTQWIFLKLYERGLAYVAEVPVNWCPELGTVLANEEVVDGKSEVGGFDVVRRPMRQWMLKITEYGDRLLDDLHMIDWPSSTHEMQKHWIGKSQGAEVDFGIDGIKGHIRIFTTRPDTLFGATYMVLAPEHPLVDVLTTPEQRADVEAYVEATKRKSDKDRQGDVKDKTGVFTGGHAINPVNDEKLPIWIADYVMMTYGTGAIMAVPGHDQRDWEFARAFNLEIREVVAGGDITKEAYVDMEKGRAVNSTTPDGKFSIDGLPGQQAIDKTIGWLEKTAKGKRAIHYKLRDWLFSRQRYWGEPFPINWVDDQPVPLKEEQLPLTLPETEKLERSGTGESPLATFDDWLNTTDAETGKPARRETNTMPQWAGSCWYYLRYLDPHNEDCLVDPKKEQYWMPVDLYIGGASHAVLHLLYARFWHKVLFDAGVVTTPEPFMKLIHQGMILGEDNVVMSKSRGNVVNPDELVQSHGADALRLYEMFMGPLETTKPWNSSGVDGVSRFLDRAWRMILNEAGAVDPSIQDIEPAPDVVRLIHQTIKKVTQDMERFQFNTAISQMMVFVNEMTKLDKRPRSAIETFVLLLSPFAPHIGEELWQRLGHDKTLAYEPWPTWDDKYLQEDVVTVAVQVNGRLRATLELPRGTKEDVAKGAALRDERVMRYVDGAEFKRVIYVPNKLLNLVIAAKK